MDCRIWLLANGARLLAVNCRSLGTRVRTISERTNNKTQVKFMGQLSWENHGDKFAAENRRQSGTFKIKLGRNQTADPQALCSSLPFDYLKSTVNFANFGHVRHYNITEMKERTIKQFP